MTALRRLKASTWSRSAAGCVAGLAFLGALPALDGAINPNEWKNQQTFEISTPSLTKLSLPPSTLDLARAELADLRIVGPRGEEVPYAVEIPARPTPVHHSPKEFRVELQRLATQLTLETGTSLPIERIELMTPARDFVKAVRVETSRDGSEWELAGDGLQIARQPGINALSLPLDDVVAEFIRLTIDDWRTPAVPFTGASLRLAAGEPLPTLPLDIEITQRDEFAGETVLTVDLRSRNMPLTLLEFATGEPLFARIVNLTQRELRDGVTVDSSVASGSIFRSRLPDQPAREHLQIPLDFTNRTRELHVHITNNDSAPLTVDAVRVFRRPVWLVFHAATPGTYRLLTGHSLIAKPSYDVGRFAADWKNLEETMITLSPPAPNPGYAPPAALAATPLLGPALDVAKWTYRKSVVLANAGVQELELDHDVLAHANRGFGDLRLLHSGRQVPYLVDRPSLFRSLPLQPQIDDDPRQPRVSRWKISLPLAGLPIRRLTFSTESTLFSRRIQIFEFARDGRGESYRRNLSDHAPWNSTPDRRGPTVTVNLFDRPLSETLYVETDNGDNPPILLNEAQADTPVVRLLFRAEGEPLHLYYGAPAVVAPTYDLELVAAQLLNADKSPATLSEEERADGRSPRKGLLFGKHGGVLLWVSLAVVVGALLFAIARLLPKPPESVSK